MILFPNAKINLGLHVLSKRQDKFHNLETLMYPIGLHDILEFIPSSEAKFKMSGIPVEGEAEDNLVYKAYLLLKEKFKLPPLKIHLHKIIPTGAGLGGGSSDAAFMLKGLNQQFDLKLSNDELQEYAARLGSDCSFFISNTPAIASGKGEILLPATNYIKDYRLLLLFPGFSVSTAEAYRGIKPDPNKDSLQTILEKSVHDWKTSLINDFEQTIFEIYPFLGDLKEKLYSNGAIYASMSGSGSAVYGLFEKNFVVPEGLRKYLIAFE